MKFHAANGCVPSQLRFDRFFILLFMQR